ncbi:MAG: hypothetical protein ACMUIP_17530 [bacterium]
MKSVLASGPIDNEVTIFDVTNTCFSVLWVIDEPSQGDLQVYDTSNNLLTEGIDYSKYNDSTNFGGSGAYSIAELNGVLVVTIYNLPHNTASTTTYNIRTVTYPQSGEQIIYPPQGSDAIAVTVMQSPIGVQLPIAANSSRWIQVLDQNGQSAVGALAILEIEGASYPVGWSRPGEMKFCWVPTDFIWTGINLTMVYDASDNKNYLNLYRPEDSWRDATLNIYGGAFSSLCQNQLS